MIRNKILKRGAHPESEIQGCEKGRGRGRRALVVVALAWLLTVAPLPWPVPSVMAATFTVNTTDDTADASPGDGVCADSAGRCSLRAAVMEANALGGGPHTIVLQAGQTYTLSKDTDGAGHRTDSGADNDDLDITSTIIIQGNGAVIQRDPSLPCNLDAVAEAGEFRIFHVQTGGSLTLDALTISNGCAGTTAGIYNDRGGAIFNINGIVNVINSTVSQNRAVYSGGGIYQYQGTLNIINSTISENYSGYGGGISAANGTVNINGSIIARNSTVADGGGIRTEGFDPIINVTNSTISGNSARYGGGIRHDDGQLNIINSTISGNSATDSGGGIWNGNPANLSFVTIANNSATSGGGISNNPGWGGIVKIKNSIVGNNTSGGDCTGTINASGVNFATDSSCGAGFTQVTSAQLNLGPLQVNPPGTTATHALQAGSVAIDAVPSGQCSDVNGNPVTQDQRGVSRPQGSACDVGAYEATFLFPAGLSIQDPNGNGVWDSGETVTVVPAWTNPGATPVAATGTASNVVNPPGVAASLTDTTADYGTIPAGGTADCQTATGNCYGITGSRTAGVWGHRDVTLDETVNGTFLKTWTLHMGPSFADVGVTDFFYRHVETLLHRNVTGGCTASDYCPFQPVTRAQMAVFISRSKLGGEPPAAGSGPGGSWDCTDGLPNHFTDVPDGVFYCRHVHWMWANGITGGCTATTYCPADPVNRAQMAVFLVRAFQLALYGP